MKKGILLCLITVCALVFFREANVGQLLFTHTPFEHSISVYKAHVWMDADEHPMATHPLFPYLQFRYLNKRTDTQQEAVKTFLKKHQGEPLAWQLHNRWMQTLASKEKWHDLLDGYQESQHSSIQCHREIAHSNLHNQLHQERVQALWEKALLANEVCKRVIKKAIADDVITQAQLWERFTKLMLAHDTNAAKSLLPHFKSKTLPKLWLQRYRDPQGLIHQPLVHSKEMSIIASNVLEKLAKRYPIKAADALKHIQKKVPITDKQKQKIEERISLTHAIRGQKKAYDYDVKTPHVKAWLVRLSLRHQDWQQVIVQIKALPEEMQLLPVWQYWLARAEEQLGNNMQATARLTALSKLRNFYGFLASAYLSTPPQLNNENTPISKRLLLKHKHLLRAGLLYFAGHQTEANREWNHALTQMTNKEKVSAAHLAHHWGWYHQAIRTLQNNEYQNDLRLRFPAPFGAQVKRYTQLYDVEPALVYAVMRQESTFKPDAQSPVGAKGLMQLMPSTAAREIAKMKKENRPTPLNLLDPTQNIQLGTKLISSLQKSQPKLWGQIAAYNAGGGFVRRWSRKVDINDVALWIETMPWKETRTYTKHVLTYYLIYSHLLGGEKGSLLNFNKLLPPNSNIR